MNLSDMVLEGDMDKDTYRHKIIEIKKDLHSYGISKVDLSGLPLKYWEDIKTACAIVYNEFPKIFKMIHSISFEKMGESDFAYVSIYDYGQFMITEQPFYMKINEGCKDILRTEDNLKRGYFSGLHNIKTFRGYFLHELTHILELSILFQNSFNGEVFKESFEDYQMIKAPMHDISKQIYNIVFGTNSLKESPLDERKYGNETFSEFFAETMAEYWELNSAKQYVVDIHREAHNQYSFCDD